MEPVAFFRNMNLGHSGSPDREALVRAFVDAGARSVWPLQTNGMAGNMTALIGRLLGVRGTSRTLGTLQRLSRQFAL